MPIEKTEDFICHEYDGLVGLTLLNIWSISKEKQTIRLYHLDRKNKEHLFILRVALLARDLYDFSLEVEGSRWNIFCLNWKVRKGFKSVKRYKPIFGEGEEWLYAKGGICVPELLDLMRKDGITRLGEDFTFADIYQRYYEGSLN
jgi:hypothetical protein